MRKIVREWDIEKIHVSISGGRSGEKKSIMRSSSERMKKRDNVDGVIYITF